MEIPSFYTSLPWMTTIWCMVLEARQTEFFANFGHFLLFYTTNNPKNQNFDKMKKRWHLHFEFFSALSPSNIPKNQNLIKNEKTYTCVPKIMIRWCTVSEIWCAKDRRTYRRMDGRTDRRKKWHIEVGAPPKNGQTYFKKIAVFPLWSPWKHQKPFGFLMFSGHQNGNTKRLLRYFWTFFNITHERTTQYFWCEIIFLHGGIHQSFSKNSS